MTAAPAKQPSQRGVVRKDAAHSAALLSAPGHRRVAQVLAAAHTQYLDLPLRSFHARQWLVGNLHKTVGVGSGGVCVCVCVCVSVSVGSVWAWVPRHGREFRACSMRRLSRLMVPEMGIRPCCPTPRGRFGGHPHRPLRPHSLRASSPPCRPPAPARSARDVLDFRAGVLDVQLPRWSKGRRPQSYASWSASRCHLAAGMVYPWVSYPRKGGSPSRCRCLACVTRQCPHLRSGPMQP
jgi:hypothetical protein